MEPFVYLLIETTLKSTSNYFNVSSAHTLGSQNEISAYCTGGLKQNFMRNAIVATTICINTHVYALACPLPWHC